MKIFRKVDHTNMVTDRDRPNKTKPLSSRPMCTSKHSSSSFFLYIFCVSNRIMGIRYKVVARLTPLSIISTSKQCSSSFPNSGLWRRLRFIHFVLCHFLSALYRIHQYTLASYKKKEWTLNVSQAAKIWFASKCHVSTAQMGFYLSLYGLLLYFFFIFLFCWCQT